MKILLARKDVRLNLKHDSQETPLILAAKNHGLAVIDTLLEHQSIIIDRSTIDGRKKKVLLESSQESFDLFQFIDA